MQTDFWLKMRIIKEKTLPFAVGLSDVDYTDFREEITRDKYKKYCYLTTSTNIFIWPSHKLEIINNP